MFITQLRLQNFKRFSDLTIDLNRQNQSKPYKLVLLIGANGSGKSSVFDAFEYISSYSKDFSKQNQDYYRKNLDKSCFVSIKTDTDSFSLSDEETPFIGIESAFYGRSSLRQLPQLTRTALGQGSLDIEKDSDRPKLFIERDLRFENDLDRITGLILRDFFRGEAGNKEIKAKYIKPINQALERIFGENTKTTPRLLEIIPPLEQNVAKITFSKGSSEIHYNLLSSGEKEVFNILINLLTRRQYYQDTIYFFDELDLHLNTSLQETLLKEITENWIPENSQLWVASHSLGFIKYANDSPHAAVIDFDNYDFDDERTLFPSPKNEIALYEVAIPEKMLGQILSGKKIIICENQNDDKYNLLGLKNHIFVGVSNNYAVFNTIKKDPTFYGLRDRDFLTDGEIKKIREIYPNYFILKYSNFENYLYHPDNIAQLNPKGFDKEAYLNEIIKQKNQRLLHIVKGIESARKTYEEIKDSRLQIQDKEEREINENTILADLETNELERFYKFYDMKKQFDKRMLEKLQLSKEKLVQTTWFKTQISALLQ
jgi:predicted ATPase